MKRLRQPRFETETHEEQRNAGHYHPGLVLAYRHRRIYLSVGRSDDVKVFTESKRVYVLSVNRSLNYAGLNIYDIEEKTNIWSASDKVELSSGWSEAGDVFFQNDWDLPEGFFDWKESKMVDYLLEYT